MGERDSSGRRPYKRPYSEERNHKGVPNVSYLSAAGHAKDVLKMICEGDQSPEEIMKRIQIENPGANRAINDVVRIATQMVPHFYRRHSKDTALITAVVLYGIMEQAEIRALKNETGNSLERVISGYEGTISHLSQGLRQAKKSLTRAKSELTIAQRKLAQQKKAEQKPDPRKDALLMMSHSGEIDLCWTANHGGVTEVQELDFAALALEYDSEPYPDVRGPIKGVKL